MKMQADKLIRMALQEDITSEDVSTNAVMRSAVKGTVDPVSYTHLWENCAKVISSKSDNELKKYMNKMCIRDRGRGSCRCR